LRLRIREIAMSRPRFGYLRVHVMLRREGWTINKKRVWRLYRRRPAGAHEDQAAQAHQPAARSRVAGDRPESALVHGDQGLLERDLAVPRHEVARKGVNHLAQLGRLELAQVRHVDHGT
jgi:hypothetical protein